MTLNVFGFYVVGIIDKGKIAHEQRKMARMMISKACRIITCISTVCLLVIVFSYMQDKPTNNNIKMHNNRLISSIDVPNLKVFEQEIRGKFNFFLPNLSILEKYTYTGCVNNLNKTRKEDQMMYWKDNAEPMRLSHLSYLTPESVVIEIGGNRGHDTNRIVKLYDPIIITLEPVEEFANHLKELFKDNKKIIVLNFGLGKITEEVFVDMKGNYGVGTSMFLKNSGSTSLIVANTTEFLLRIGAQRFDFDLLLINCEGCEFEVLEAALSSGLISKFKNIQFQTHDLPGIRDQDSRYCQIETLLDRTHAPTYRYQYVWEHWRRNNLS